MDSLDTAARLQAPDAFFAALIAAHRDLTREQSEALSARLVLLLANQIGTQSVLIQAIDAARASLPPAERESTP